MDREALDALEQRVSTLRIITAEKAVLARSLAQPEPIRFQNEIATAILALAVFVAFLAGREVGLFAAHGDPCPGLPSGEPATITLTTDTYTVAVDTYGYLRLAGGPTTMHPGTKYTRVSPSIARELANRLAQGCFFEKRPPDVEPTAMGWSVLTLQVGRRTVFYRHPTNPAPILLCGGHDDIGSIEGALMKVGRVDELFAHP